MNPLKTGSKIGRYFWNIFISIDQFINTLFGGDPDETISSRLGKWERANKNSQGLKKWIYNSTNTIVELIEKIIHSHLKDNNLHAQGEWFNLNVKDALSIVETFPLSREDLTKGVGDKLENTLDLTLYAWNKKIIDEDEYDVLQESFESGNSEENYEFNNFTFAINP